ncbi:hypothetical protein [Legionella worsleiensis]|uniref:Substrate of the Dot/Icm system n=1 Tax=Legionella worsleiensis TaxID=45076 RepID=A0A0W1A9H7_9GAMM|nr:hypothetical protein [Legionella worsleiensis]KTD77986.1 substrate of the Dot/Icm system [Legionella worsleiensis]STY31545.1 SidB [Legionella worsleiensis]
MEIESYQAPKPKFSAWQQFKFIALRIVFPPVLLWDLLKTGANKLLGAFVGRFVLPAQYMFTDDESNYSLWNDDTSCPVKYKIITHDGAHLDTLEFQHPSQNNTEPHYQKYIINFVGNSMRYEDILYDMKQDAKTLNANVVGFNFRGVGQSKVYATSKDDLVTDGIAQVQRLLDKGVSPQNITLKGLSLGAGIASLVAHHFHQTGQPVNLFNDRSFSSITDFVVGIIRLERDEYGDAPGHKDSQKGIILGWLA